MKRNGLFFCVIFVLVSLSLAQDQSSPPPATPGHHHQMAMDYQKMADMHKQQMEAMQADVDKMKASLDQMKANVASIGDANEKARWQTNVDLWTVMVGHMEQMLKHMEDMGPGMGMMSHHHDMKGAPAAPPSDKKPE